MYQNLKVNTNCPEQKQERQLFRGKKTPDFWHVLDFWLKTDFLHQSHDFWRPGMTILLIKHFFDLKGLLFIFSDNTILGSRSFLVGLSFLQGTSFKNSPDTSNS